MPANTPFSVVQNGPRFTPLKYGLLSAAQIVDDGDPHWQAGTLFQPDACAADKSVSAFCVAGGPATGTPAKTPSATGAPASAAEPFTIYAYADCSPVGWGDNVEDLVARATRQLDAGEGRTVERTFWTGVPDGGPTVHPHLAEDTQVLATAQGATTIELQSAATVIGGAAVPPLEAFASLEGALAACYGGEGVLHVPFRALSLLANQGILEKQGPQLRSKGGMIVAAYASGSRHGPTGAEPAAGTGWFYGTGAVMARRSAIKPAGQRPADFVGRTDNSTVFLVERTYAIDWDCCHFAIQVSGLGQ